MRLNIPLALSLCLASIGPADADDSDLIYSSGFESIRVTFDALWSEQFPGWRFNALPINAGLAGNPANRILMAERADGIAYAGATLSILADPLDYAQLKVRLAQVPVGDGAGIGPAIAPPVGTAYAGTQAREYQFELDVVDADLEADEFHVIVWKDTNDDDDWQQDEPRWTSAQRFTIVSSELSGNLHAIMFGRILAATLFEPFLDVPTATAFANAFLENEPINLDGGYPAAPINFFAIEQELQDSLDFRVGVDLAPGGVGGPATMRNFFIPPTSTLATNIVASEAFQTTIDEYLSDFVDPILAAANSDGTFTIGLPSSISFGRDHEIDNDLHFTFNSARLEGNVILDLTCTGGFVDVRSYRVDGRLIDLYDFDYASSPVTDGHQMALLQATHGTLDDGAGIFRTEVRLQGDVLPPFISTLSCESGNPEPNPWQPGETPTLIVNAEPNDVLYIEWRFPPGFEYNLWVYFRFTPALGDVWSPVFGTQENVGSLRAVNGVGDEFCFSMTATEGPQSATYPDFDDIVHVAYSGHAPESDSYVSCVGGVD